MLILGIITVNFCDKEHHRLIRVVEIQLQKFGLQTRNAKIPLDAIACALDEVQLFPNIELRKLALMKLENHFRARWQEAPEVSPMQSKSKT